MEIEYLIKFLKQSSGQVFSKRDASFLWMMQRQTQTLIDRGAIEELIIDGEVFYKLL
ncbi:hypothetical protein ACNQGB_04665 [Flavobacterium sp. XS1P32]|uniref:hypothetical protein n=1 Tax=unclassified Flavobacterium TaxID=196869 RepID=UPI003AAC198D